MGRDGKASSTTTTLKRTTDAPTSTPASASSPASSTIYLSAAAGNLPIRSTPSSTPSSVGGKPLQSLPSSKAFPCPLIATITTARRDVGGLLDIATGFGSNRCGQLSNDRQEDEVLPHNANAAADIAANKALFPDPTPGTFGTSARNIVNEPGIENFVLGLYKNTNITERAKFQLRFEAFNAFNHPQFDVDNSQQGGGNMAVNNARDSGQVGDIGAAVKSADPPNQRQVHLLAAISPPNRVRRRFQAAGGPGNFPVCWRPCVYSLICSLFPSSSLRHRSSASSIEWRRAIPRGAAGPEGQQAMASGRFDVAEAAFVELAKLEPNVAELYANLGAVYFQEGKIEPPSTPSATLYASNHRSPGRRLC